MVVELTKGELLGLYFFVSFSVFIIITVAFLPLVSSIIGFIIGLAKINLPLWEITLIWIFGMTFSIGWLIFCFKKFIVLPREE